MELKGITIHHFGSKIVEEWAPEWVPEQSGFLPGDRTGGGPGNL
jgi:hypothetical protein